MKIKRHKRIRKILQFYHLSYHISPPYRVVVDPHFIQASHTGKVMIRDQLPTLFHNPTTAYITPCILAWMEGGGRAWEASAFIGRQLSFLSCRHKKKGKIHPEACIKALLTPQRHLMEGAAESGGTQAAKNEQKEQIEEEEEDGEDDDDKHADDIKAAAAAVEAAARNNKSASTTTAAASASTTSLSSSTRLPASIPSSLSHMPLNPDKLIVAAQSATLRDWVRATPGIPLLFLHGSVPVMEAPSGVERFDRKAKAAEEGGKLTEVEEKALSKVKEKQQQQNGAGGEWAGKPRKKKAKGPNPMSVKKKKKKTQQQAAGGAGGGGGGGKRKQTEVPAEASSSSTAEAAGNKRRKTDAVISNDD